MDSVDPSGLAPPQELPATGTEATQFYASSASRANLPPLANAGAPTSLAYQYPHHHNANQPPPSSLKTENVEEYAIIFFFDIQ